MMHILNGSIDNIYNQSGDTDIQNGNIGLINNGTGNVKIIDGTIRHINNRGKLSISGGNVYATATIHNTGASIHNYTTGIVEITGGTISHHYNLSENSIDNEGIITIKGGSILGEPAIVNKPDANLTIEGGEISGNILNNGNTTIIGGKTRHIGNGGTLTIGEKGGGVSKLTPQIVGDTYGISNNGTLNFYDGIIKGKTAYISGTVTEVEPYYEVSLSTDEEGYQCATLTHTSQEDMCAVVNGTYYNTIQAAIDAVIGSEPITLVNGANITEAINIPEGKNITIDLAGFTINSTAENHAIINNGTLRIMDSSEGKTGAIVNQNGSAIQNNGQLTIDEGVTVTPQ